MLYGSQFDCARVGWSDPVPQLSNPSGWTHKPLSASQRHMPRCRWGIILLCCWWSTTSWSQEPCTLPQNSAATAQRTQEETADAQGILFLRNKSTHCALSSFKEEIRIKPEAWQGHYHAGLAYLDLSDGRHAAAELEIAVSQAATRAEIRLALGLAHETLGEYTGRIVVPDRLRTGS